MAIGKFGIFPYFVYNIFHMQVAKLLLVNFRKFTYCKSAYHKYFCNNNFIVTKTPYTYA